MCGNIVNSEAEILSENNSEIDIKNIEEIIPEIIPVLTDESNNSISDIPENSIEIKKTASEIRAEKFDQAARDWERRMLLINATSC